MNWEIGINIQRLPCVKQIASGNIMYSTGSSAQCCDDLEGWDGGEGGDTCIHTPNSLHGTAETNAVL